MLEALDALFGFGDILTEVFKAMGDADGPLAFDEPEQMAGAPVPEPVMAPLPEKGWDRFAPEQHAF